MGSFYLLLFSRGSNWTDEYTEEVEALQRQHNQYLNHLHDTYRAVSGPFVGAQDELSGMTLLPAQHMSEDEVADLVAQDPAVKAKRLRVDVRRWHTPPNFIVLG